MADLLPSVPDTSAPEDAEPRVVGLDDDAADDVLGALSSETARELFAALNENPAHPSALADRVDTTLQNVQYHLGKLEDAELVEVVDTAYSEKGREMDVYAPADRPLVVFAGDEDDRSLLSRALGRLLGGVGAVVGGAFTARGLFESASVTEDGANEAAPGATTDAPDSSADAAVPDDGVDAEGIDTQGVESPNAEPQGTDSGEAGDVVIDTEDPGAEPTQGGQGLDTDGMTLRRQDGGDATADGATATDSAADAGGEAAEPAVETVTPLADSLGWVGDALAATGLPPGFAVLAIGSLAVAGYTYIWYRRERQTRV